MRSTGVQRSGSGELPTVETLLRTALGVERGSSLSQAAELMERTGTGSLAVLDGSRLVGIVTERDLVRRGLARHLPTHARLDAVMSSPVVTVEASATVQQVSELFCSRAVRQIAVVRDGEFVGMVVIDDVLAQLAGGVLGVLRPKQAQSDGAAPTGTTNLSQSRYL